MNVELLQVFGDDNMVVDAARVSYGKSASQYTTEQNESLIKYLVVHGHTSPLRHPQLQYRFHVPIFVERQLFKHQVGLTANSVSGRYVDFNEECYHPAQWRYQSTSSKQGSSGVVFDEEENSLFVTMYRNVVEDALELYKHLVSNGVAREQARLVLPLSTYTTFVWTGSLLAFLHLFDLRTKVDAQQETREVSLQALDSLRKCNKFPHVLRAWGY